MYMVEIHICKAGFFTSPRTKSTILKPNLSIFNPSTIQFDIALKLSLLACLCSLCSLVSADLELTEPGQQGAVVPVGEVGVEDGGQRQGARHHPEDGQHPGQAQAGAGHGHWQLNTEY